MAVQRRLLRVSVEAVVYRDPEDPKWWIAEAIYHGEIVADQGRSPEEAVENLREALLLTIEDIHGVDPSYIDLEIVPYVKRPQQSSS